MMLSSSRPPITQNQIPTVKKLCEHLGFGQSYDRPDSYLRESTQSWRKQYKTRGGTLGRNLVEWRQQKTQIDLKSMTQDYLEKGGYGSKLWPANDIDILEYPKDKHRITELLMQLFWKENNHEAHNAKHPDRGRRVRESIESDQSSTTLASPTMPECPNPRYPSAQIPRQPASKSVYPGIGVGSIPKGPFNNALHRSDLSLLQKNTPERQTAASPTQSSGSLFVPSTADTEDASTALQSSLPTLTGDSTESVVPDIPDEVREWCDDDPKRSAKERASKRITSSFRHPWKNSSDGETATSVAPVAKMLTSPAASQRTSKKARPEQTTPLSRSAGTQALHGRSSAESTRRRRRDVDGDDEDAEYIPRPRLKRQKATSNASDDVSIAVEPQPSDPDIGASPTRTCGAAADHECPGCYTILSHIADGSLAARESHVDACINSKLSSSPSAPAPEARKSNTVLPNRPRGKRPALATLITPNVDNRMSVPESPSGDVEHEDMVDNAQDYLGRSLPNASEQNPPPLPSQGVDFAERSLPSPESSSALPENVNPGPRTSACQMYKRRVLPFVWHGGTPEQRGVPDQTRQAQPHNGPEPEIHYYIIASRSPRLSKIHWPQGSLADSTVDSIFDEVSEVASRRNVQRMAFKLTTSTSDIQYTIARNDVKIYEIMKKAFSKDINADLAKGNTEFDIELEIDPGKSGAPAAVEGNAVDCAFSF